MGQHDISPMGMLATYVGSDACMFPLWQCLTWITSKLCQFCCGCGCRIRGIVAVKRLPALHSVCSTIAMMFNTILATTQQSTNQLSAAMQPAESCQPHQQLQGGSVLSFLTSQVMQYLVEASLECPPALPNARITPRVYACRRIKAKCRHCGVLDLQQHCPWYDCASWPNPSSLAHMNGSAISEAHIALAFVLPDACMDV